MSLTVWLVPCCFCACSMSRVRTFNEPATVPWYGSEHVLDAWLHCLVKA